MEKETLLIPQGIKQKTEIFDGFGKTELYQTIVVTIIAGILTAIIYLLFHNILTCVVFLMVTVCGTIMILTRDNHNMSVVKQASLYIKFVNSQKLFRYKRQ